MNLESGINPVNDREAFLRDRAKLLESYSGQFVAYQHGRFVANGKKFDGLLESITDNADI